MTPVDELGGWVDMLDELVLPENRDRALADFVRVFRDGLDISRMVAEPEARVQSEVDWWNQAALSLEAIVGPDQVGIVLRWLETVFGRRDGMSS
ncbi:MAG: hypothetical protein M3Q39_04750 [Actinomycetota bacterium]|nr:hypothetical protein [Actinomycetota bacterium]